MIAGDTAIVPDVKTTQDTDPHMFRRSVIEYGYHLQEAHYTAGIRAAYGVEKVNFMFLAVESQEPFEVCLHNLSASDSRKAAKQRLTLLRMLKESMEQSIWKNDWSVGVNELEELPDYAFGN